VLTLPHLEDFVDGIGRLHLKGNGVAGDSFNEDMHVVRVEEFNIRLSMNFCD